MKRNFLKEIVAYKKEVNKLKKAYYKTLINKIGKDSYTRYFLFKNVITKPDAIQLIAEIKKASPSKGLLREDFDPLVVAQTYVNHKAAAISVLTEDKYFLGKPLYVKKVADHFNVPVLAKDFFIDEGQIYEARVNGASAILLIMAILTDKKLKQLQNIAHQLDLDCLVEVHDEEELTRALNNGAEIIGINNRNLQTFEVNIKTAHELIPKIPKSKTIVAESGITSHKEVEELKALGAHAVLIGETFMRATDIGKKIDEIMEE